MMHSDIFAAHPDAVAAEDTFAGIPDDGGAGQIQFFFFPAVPKTDPMDAELDSQRL